MITRRLPDLIIDVFLAAGSGRVLISHLTGLAVRGLGPHGGVPFVKPSMASGCPLIPGEGTPGGSEF